MAVLEGKVTLITGALGGQGRVACQRFAAEGAIVIATDHHESGADKLIDQLQQVNRRSIFVPLDIRDSNAVDLLAVSLKSIFGGIDTIYNNAGVNINKPLGDITNLEWDNTIAVNMSSIFYIARAFVPLMTGRKGCSITNISSMGALRVYPRQIPYSAAKAAVIQMTQSLAYELAPEIRVNAICPGVIYTEMAQKWIASSPDPDATFTDLLSGIPMGRMGEPEEIVNAGIWLASDQASYITGAIIPVDGGSTVPGK